MAAALQTEEFRPTEGEIIIAAGGGPRGHKTPEGTATPVPTGPDLIIAPGEVHNVDAGVTENYRHALNGGTARNAGTIQMDGTDS